MLRLLLNHHGYDGVFDKGVAGRVFMTARKRLAAEQEAKHDDNEARNNREERMPGVGDAKIRLDDHKDAKHYHAHFFRHGFIVIRLLALDNNDKLPALFLWLLGECSK